MAQAVPAKSTEPSIPTSSTDITNREDGDGERERQLLKLVSMVSKEVEGKLHMAGENQAGNDQAPEQSVCHCRLTVEFA